MEFIFIVIILILSIVIHELAHGYAALAQGDPTAKNAGRLTMNPIKHLDLYGSFIVPLILYILPTGFVLGWAKPVPYNPYNLKNQRWGDSLVSIAGPGANIIIALIFGLLIRFGSGALPQEAILLSGLIVIINIVLALFNLIPLPPLDGSKILFDLLPGSFKFSQIRMFLEQNGLIIILITIFFFGRFIFGALFSLLYLTFSYLTGDASLIDEVFQTFFSSGS